MDWKDLEIGNIPSDFFVNEKYEIESRYKGVEWLETSFELVSERYYIIEEIQKDKRLEYRYRLKPLEPIRITEKLFNILSNEIYKELREGTPRKEAMQEAFTYEGRTVEIID